MPNRFQPDPELARAIDAVAHAASGRIAVSARDPARGRAVDRLAVDPFPAASVIKVPILVELFARVDAGSVSLDDRIPLRDSDRTEGSGVLQLLSAGLAPTLEDLAQLMITISDNTASNMLIDLLGCDRINARMESLGLTRLRLERRFFDLEALERGLDNRVCAGELTGLLLAIQEHRAASPESCERMLAIMRRQQLSSKLPRLLPPGTPVAHKTGTISNASHDIGIIYSPAGPLVVSVLTHDVPEDSAAKTAIRRIGRLVFDHWGT